MIEPCAGATGTQTATAISDALPTGPPVAAAAATAGEAIG